MFEFKKLYLEEIKTFCKQNKVSLIEGIIHWCDKNNMEVEYIANLVKRDSKLKKKIFKEARSLNSIKVRRYRKKHK